MRDVSERLLPYVPRLVVDWLRDSPTVAHRRLEGTLAFCDVSGFTALTERLAAGGKAGAEEMGEILNEVFTELLVGAYDQGAALLKYGGDAVLLLFRGDEHETRACRAAWDMQRVMARLGDLRTSVGPSRLQMSVGIHSGEIDFFLAGSAQRELIVTGPAATETAKMESAAAAGEILVSVATAALLSPACLGSAKADGVLLAGPPGLIPFETFPVGELPDLSIALAPAVVEHINGGWTGSEHRVAVPGFLQFRGMDQLLESVGPAGVAEQLDLLVDTMVHACTLHGVTFIGTDIAPDGGKAIVVGGAPRAASDAEGRVLLSLSAALAVTTDLRLRAGAAAGRLFAGDYGPPYRRTYSGIGDAVNLAARVMGHAGDGELLATTALLASSRTGFDTTSLEPFPVKGKTELVLAARVDGVAVMDRHLDETLPFVGREAEVAALLVATDACIAGQGRALQVIGSAGSGKTRLLRQALNVENGLAFIRFACDSYSSVTPYSVIRHVVRCALGGDDHVARRLELALASEPALRPWAPLVGALLGLELPITPEVAALNERFRQSKLAETVLGLLDCLLTSPTALLIDDVHLADEGSRQLLDALARQARERPWLLVLTRRSTSELDETGPVESDHLVLAPIADDAMREALLTATEDSAVPAHEVDLIVSRAAGNPLYAREMLQAVQAGELAGLPDGLEALVASQIDRLAPGPRRLLRVAAVCGMAIDRQMLEAVLGAAQESHDDGEWAGLGRFVTPTRGGWRFREALVRDTAYEGLPFVDRKHLHGLIGSALSCDPAAADDERLALLAFHHSSAQRDGDALFWSRAAGDRAAQRFATREAARFYELALAAARRIRPSPVEEISTVSMSAGISWFVLGENERADAAFARHPRSATAEARAEVDMWRARVRLRIGAYSKGLRLLTAVERVAMELPRETAGLFQAEVLAQRAFVRHMQGREREAARWAREAVAVAERSNAKRSLALGYQMLDWSLVAQNSPEAGPWLERALEIYRELEDLAPQARIYNHLGIGAYYRGEWPLALEHYEQAREIFDRTGDAWFSSIVAGNIAEIYVEQGRLEEAIAPTRLALRAAKVAGARSFIALWTAQLGRIAIRDGRADEGLGLLGEARDIYAADGEAVSALIVEAQIAAGLALTGRAVEALTTARTALEQLGKVPGAAEAEALMQRARGFALLALGRKDEGVAAFQASLVAARVRTGRRDIALGLDALIANAEAPAEQVQAWLAERDELVASLGITRLSGTTQAPPTLTLVPEQASPEEHAEPSLAG